MSDQFDPYYVWLGIPPKDQPPNHYRLLGIEVFEDNEQVIDVAANRQTTYLHEMASGPNAKHSQQLLNEIAGARACLLDPDRKLKYDDKLREQFAPKPEPEPAATASEPEPEPPADASDAPAMIPLTCNSCSAFYEVDAADAGTLVECVCGYVMTVPVPGDVESSESYAGPNAASSGEEEPASAVAVAAPAVAVADEPDAAAPSSESVPKKKRQTKSASGKKPSAKDAAKSEPEAIRPRKKKSGWGMTVVVGLGTIVMAIVLFKVLTADPAPEDEPEPPARTTQSRPGGDSDGASEPVEEETDGSGSFGLRLDDNQ